MIAVEHVSKLFKGVTAVDDISFIAYEEETMVLLGTSGCGKTTTLKMINRLIEPSEGSILLNGENINAQPPEILRRSIGYVLQNIGLFPHYTVAENIGVVPKLLKWDHQKIKTRTKELLEELQMPPDKYLSVYPDQLSGGQQQRVGFARALIANPPVLLMDEPFGALDPVTRKNIRKDFLQLAGFKRKTIIMVTHDIPEAFELGDRICLMDKGKIVQAGTPADLLFRPTNDFVKIFFTDYRLQLEFNIVSLEDVWDHLQDQPGNVLPVHLSYKESIWKAMEMLTKESRIDKPLVQIKHANNESKRVGFDELVAAFSNLNKSTYAGAGKFF